MMQHHQWTGHLATLRALQHLPAANAPHVRPQRFHVTATTADGQCRTWTATGGASCDHAQAAMDAAGLGGVVRVVALPEEAAA